MQKRGTVLLIGRPNVGKSTFVNNLVGQKVAITSPKPQTTRFPIWAVYEEERGSIVIIDTPGIIGKTEDQLSKKINEKTLQTLNEEVDLVLYIVDQSRKRDYEESRVLGIVRALKKPKILIINKVDIKESYLAQYLFLTEEMPVYYKISAKNHAHFKELVDKIFELLPEKNDSDFLPPHRPYPLLNMDSKTFVSELIREKVFLMTGEEIPYTTTVVVEEIKERSNGLMFIKAQILTTEERYKRMIIGTMGRRIKEIGSFARKEISLATNKKVYLDLKVDVDPHWQDVFY